MIGERGADGSLYPGTAWLVAVPVGLGDGTAVPARSLTAPFAGVGAAFAFTIAALVGGPGRQVPDRALHRLLITGLIGGSAVLVTGRGGPLIVASSSFYVAATTYTSRFFTQGVAVCYLAGAGLADGVVLGLNDDGAAPAEWLLIMAPCTAAALVVATIRGQLRRVAMTDTLTGPPNRQGLDSSSNAKSATADGEAGPLSLAMVTWAPVACDGDLGPCRLQW